MRHWKTKSKQLHAGLPEETASGSLFSEQGLDADFAGFPYRPWLNCIEEQFIL